ncbi:MAG TPA: lysophospholipid acyltransferase family protein [Candidatus Acidoferrales bacterium]|nr:lysophospholipid acyltransferase family protein [Candidatus Acidoferrales bacterium]
MEETEKAGAPAEAHSPDGRDIGRDDASEHASEGARYVAAPNVHFDTGLRALSPWRRAQIPLIAGAVYSLVRTVGPSLRYEIIGWQHAERVYARGLRVIWPFWHQCIVPVLWWGRHRGVVVLNSTNFDGQWTRRVIERLGFGTAQGSSTRGGLRGLVVMAQRLAEGKDAGFTIDGPRGPRFVAKPGPVMLARKSGCPIIPFHVDAEKSWTLARTWDQFQFPRPFSRCVMMFHPPIYVAADAEREEVERKHAEMQRALERIRDAAQGWWKLSPADRDRRRAEWNA